MSIPSNPMEGFQELLQLVGIVVREGPPEPRGLVRIVGPVVVTVFVAPDGVRPDARVAPRSLGTAGALAFKLRRPHSLRWLVPHFSVLKPPISLRIRSSTTILRGRKKRPAT